MADIHNPATERSVLKSYYYYYYYIYYCYYYYHLLLLLSNHLLPQPDGAPDGVPGDGVPPVPGDRDLPAAGIQVSLLLL